MNAEFNWWLLIVGLVVGAAIVYLVLADSSRREAEIDAVERPQEAAWISASLRAEGRPVDPETAERILELHRLYRTAPPPDELAAETAPEVSAGRLGDPLAEARVEPDAAPEPATPSALRDHPDVERN